MSDRSEHPARRASGAALLVDYVLGLGIVLFHLALLALDGRARREP